jgi:beta-glucanase (GH16 family)
LIRVFFKEVNLIRLHIFLFSIVFFNISYISYSQEFNLKFGNNCDGGKLVLPVENIDFCKNSPWILIFEEDFSENVIDLNKWRNSDARCCNCSEPEIATYLTFGNIIIENGILKIHAQDEQVIEKVHVYKDDDDLAFDGLPNLRTFKYTSGLIRTYQTFRYGYFEASCKVSKGKGFWPAMWMYGNKAENNNDPATLGNEIDVFEFWKNNTVNHNMNVHVGKDACLEDYDGIDFSEDFHIFSMLWEPHVIKWYVDGMLVRSYPRYYQAGKEVGCMLNAWQVYEEAIFPTNPMLIYFDLFIDRNKGYSPDESTTFPGIFEIDWIRFYQREHLIPFDKIINFSSAIFPNPARESIFISIFSTNTTDYTVSIFNETGNCLLSNTYSGTSIEIPIANLKSGFYFIRILGKDLEFIGNHKLIVIN